MNRQQKRLRAYKHKLQVTRRQNKALTGQVNQKNADPYADQIKSAVSLKFGPQETQLNQLTAASDQRQGQLHDWFGQYVASVNAAKEQQAKDQATAVTQIRGDQNVAQTSDQAGQAKLDQSAADLAKITGGNFDSGRNTEAQAESNRRALGDINVAQLAKTGLADVTYLGNRATTGAAFETRAHLDEGARKSNLTKQLGDLRAQKGDYAVQYGQQLKQQDITNQLNQAALGVKAQTAANTAALGEERIKVTSQNSKRSARTQRTRIRDQRERDAYQRAHGLGPYKPPKGSSPKGSGPTRAQKLSAQNKYDQAVSTLNLAGKPYVAKKGEAFMRNYLTSQKGVPAWLAQAAVQTVLYGGVGPTTARKVRKKYGIKLKQFTPKAPRAPSATGIRTGTGQA